MVWIVSVLFFLMARCITADDSTQGTTMAWHYSYSIGVIVGSALVTVIFSGLTYIIVISTRKKVSSAQYFVDDVSIEKDANAYYDNYMNQNVAANISNINQIHPILSGSQIVSSIRLSFENMGHVINTHRWFPSQRHAFAETPVHKMNVSSV